LILENVVVNSNCLMVDFMLNTKIFIEYFSSVTDCQVAGFCLELTKSKKLFNKIMIFINRQ